MTDDSIHLPIALRKEPRARAGKPHERYGFEHDIAKYVSYDSLSPGYRALIASLQSVVIPRDWKVAKHDPKCYEAMLEEMKALEKNKTWDLVPLPVEKSPVTCMHNPRSEHFEAAHRILRYLKGSPGRDLWFKGNGHLNVEGYCDVDWANCLDDKRWDPLLDIVFLLEGTLWHEEARRNLL